MTLLAIRLIDVAIFGTLGTLWASGGVFIFLLWRWIIRREREGRTQNPVPIPVEPEVAVEPMRGSPHLEPASSAAAKAFTLAHG